MKKTVSLTKMALLGAFLAVAFSGCANTQDMIDVAKFLAR